uniref:Transmembrane protein 119 n=1 Tax=Accipiter nisus TaxID=211598 RepID=A0A8B9MRI5_9AVES
MAIRLATGMWLLLLLLLLVAPVRSAAPRHAAVLADSGGSGDGEEVSAAPPIHRVTPGTGPTLGDAAGTTVTNSSAPGSMLDGLVDFFKEYMLLVVVVGSLAFVLLFIICAAVIVRQKHKASAYYPSSFPKKKYVDQRDKAGGARAFSEVPEKAPDPSAEEPLDCSRQLQADILAAAQNLKSPPRAPGCNGSTGRGGPQCSPGWLPGPPQPPVAAGSGDAPRARDGRGGLLLHTYVAAQESPDEGPPRSTPKNPPAPRAH